MSQTQKIRHALKGEFIKLSDLLKVTGVCMTGGEAGILIQSGKVFRNGELELRKRAKITSGEKISTQHFEIEVH